MRVNESYASRERKDNLDRSQLYTYNIVKSATEVIAYVF
jgi:hypothetical protein